LFRSAQNQLTSQIAGHPQAAHSFVSKHSLQFSQDGCCVASIELKTEMIRESPFGCRGSDGIRRPGGYGKSPRFAFADRTFSTPSVIAAVRCEIPSLFARSTICPKARSRIWYSRRVT